MNHMNESWPQLFEFVTDTLKDGKDFAVEQAPMVVQEYLHWQFAAAIFGAVFFGLLAVVVWAMAPRVDEAMDADGEAAFGLRCVAALAFVLAVGLNGYDAVKVKVAPRIVLIEYARAVLAGR